MTQATRKILADTSAWVEMYRRTGSPVDVEMTAVLAEPSRLAVTEPVVMELLAGRRPLRQVTKVRRRLLSFTMMRVGGLETYERAAAILRECRTQGETVRNSIDCLIAAVALREGVPVLHDDRDFDIIALHTGLRIQLVGT